MSSKRTQLVFASALALIACVMRLDQGSFSSESIAAAQGSPDEAAPFGLTKGLSVSQVGGKAVGSGGMYRLTSVPKPHPAFESYLAQIAPKTGLCFLKGVGKTIQTNVFGSTLRIEYTKLRDQVSQTYGKYKESDSVLPGSIWTDPEDFMMGLLKKDRVLASQWDMTTGSTLKRSLKTILVGVQAQSQESGWIFIEYYFDNEPACQKEIDAATASVL